MSLAIETKDLSKSFGEVHAVQKINLKVREGEIYGFLGLNGAGKTTTIRALLGMISPSTGSVKVLGQNIDSGERGPWKDIGHSVEKPAAYPELTVKENLEIARRLQGISDKNAVERVISQLKIAPYARVIKIVFFRGKNNRVFIPYLLEKIAKIQIFCYSTFQRKRSRGI